MVINDIPTELMTYTVDMLTNDMSISKWLKGVTNNTLVVKILT